MTKWTITQPLKGMKYHLQQYGWAGRVLGLVKSDR